ncbi:hypothetical protein OF83DRAFT_1120299 [Amylostereum chailletii]|nr:hypothetical protein OF83DRAFT_1120299 [Amylostereum chailletii]
MRVTAMAMRVSRPRPRDDSLTDLILDSYPANPYLQYRPHFSRSLPSQIVATTAVLTLLAVLLLQLVFTAQYHWQLARLNFVLQITALLALLGSTIASIVTILNNTMDESQTWPYMLSYIAVDLPPLSPNSGAAETWSMGTLAAWTLGNALWSALIQLTHIQFLTLLYPSRLEARLIFILLGPLAIVAAVMQMFEISQKGTATGIPDAVRNICNATLSLLFTIALFLWGFVVNRKQAWRTDGGTAIFGAGALFLAISSTALTFVYIPSAEQYDYLPPLTGAVMLWQSFLGWWWWVGAGMGVGEVEELMRREEKRRRKKRVRDARRKEHKEKARVLWSDMTGKLTGRARRGSSSTSSASEPPTSPTSPTSATSLSTPSASVLQNAWLGRRVLNTSLAYIRATMQYLRHSHIVAAQQRAEGQVARMNAAFGEEAAHDTPDRPPAVHGWGLGSFGIRQREREERSIEMEGFEGLVRRRHDHGEDEGTTEERVEVRIEELPPTPKTIQDPRASVWWWGPLRRWRLQDSTVY